MCDCKRGTRGSCSEIEEWVFLSARNGLSGIRIGDPMVHGFLALMGRSVVDIWSSDTSRVILDC